MPTTTFMVLTDRTGALLPGESTTPVFDPYLKQGVAHPIEIASFDGTTENTFSPASGGGGGSGKVVFDPFTVSKYVDATSQTLFLSHAAGFILKFVDLLVVRTGEGGGSTLKPYLSYRLGTVAISEIRTSSDEQGVREDVSFVFGQLQIGYQAQKPDGSYAPFAPVGWDRIRNVQI